MRITANFTDVTKLTKKLNVMKRFGHHITLREAGTQCFHQRNLIEISKSTFPIHYLVTTTLKKKKSEWWWLIMPTPHSTNFWLGFLHGFVFPPMYGKRGCFKCGLISYKSQHLPANAHKLETAQPPPIDGSLLLRHMKKSSSKFDFDKATIDEEIIITKKKIMWSGTPSSISNSKSVYGPTFPIKWRQPHPPTQFLRTLDILFINLSAH